MKKYVTKNPIINAAIAVVLIALGVLALIFSDEVASGIRWMVAIVLVGYTFVRLRGELRAFKTDAAKAIIFGDAVLTLVFAVALVIESGWMPLHVFLGLVLYLKGLSYLGAYVAMRRSPKPTSFVFKMVLITAGAYVWFSGWAVEQTLLYVIAALLLLYALVFLGVAISQWQAQKAAKPKQAPKPEPTTKPEKKEEPKPTPSTYTKASLMKKSVDELRQMSKSRKITGYSNMRKEQLVEKLWLFEQEAAADLAPSDRRK